MAYKFTDRLEHAWNAFRGRDKVPEIPLGGEVSYGHRPDRPQRLSSHNYRRIIAPILTQIAVDAAGVELRHVRTGDNNEYLEDISSGLNECLTTNPNLDQAPTFFRQDVVSTMLDEGVVAIVPVETTLNPEYTGGYDITQLRAGIITSWNAQNVRVDLYDERFGRREEIWLPKHSVGIVQNPLYAIMNEPNSMLQRLVHKLGQLDVTDDRLAAGKLDIIVQLPYTIKHETRLKEAGKRISDIETQLLNSRHGIGYIDSTERITQLNRPSENNLLEQVKTLEGRVYAQLGLTDEIFYGTADEAAMLNYQNRTVFPIVRAIQEEMRRKFLTKTARTQKQSIHFFRDPFSLVPVSQIAEIADKFTRNEIMAPNEFRPIVGRRPVQDPAADELRNRNMPKVPDEVTPSVSGKPVPKNKPEPVPAKEQNNEPEGNSTDEA